MFATSIISVKGDVAQLPNRCKLLIKNAEMFTEHFLKLVYSYFAISNVIKVSNHQDKFDIYIILITSMI